MFSFQNTPWKDLSNINNLLKLVFALASFDIFQLFQWKRLKKWKYLKCGGRDIQFKQFIDSDMIYKKITMF